MRVFKRWKTIILILLVIILGFYAFGRNSEYKIYVEEDKQQFITRIDTLISRSKSRINSLTISEDGGSRVENIEILMIHTTNLERSMVNFEKKINLIDKDIGSEFENISSEIIYKGEINLEDINLYYEKLLENIESEEKSTLKDQDIQKFDEIYNFYNNINKHINDFIEDNQL